MGVGGISVHQQQPAPAQISSNVAPNSVGERFLLCKREAKWSWVLTRKCPEKDAYTEHYLSLSRKLNVSSSIILI